MQSEGFKNIGIGGGMLLLAYGAYRFFRKKDLAETAGTDEFQEAALKKIAVDSKKLTRDGYYYKTIADRLENELSRRIPLLDIYTYDSQKVFSAVDGLNADEQKQLLKEFGVRSLKVFNLVKLSDGGTLFEWFDNILSEKDLQRMRAVFAPIGLWQKPQNDKSKEAYNNYYSGWLSNHLGKVTYPNARLNAGRSVYTQYVGEGFRLLDSGWWDINSYKAKKGASGDFFLRADDATTPLGTITGVYRDTATGKVFLIKVKLTHPKLRYSGNVNLKGREVWLFPQRLTDTPYKPPLSGLLIPVQNLTELL